MTSIRCQKCQHENPPDCSVCEECGTDLKENSKPENEDLAKAKPLMQEKQISDDTQNLRDDTLPKSGEEWQEALERHKAEKTGQVAAVENGSPAPEAAVPVLETDTPAPQVAREVETPVHDGQKDITVEAKALDSDAILQMQAAEEERRKTEELPNMDDEESVLRIGSVRFKGDLVLKHQETSTDFTVKNNALQEVVIGRLDRVTGFSPTVDLTEVGGKTKGVSRRHATISIRGDLLVITDHNSMNGTFLNGQRLVPEQARVLRDTDVLRIGRVSLLIHFKNY